MYMEFRSVQIQLRGLLSLTEPKSIRPSAILNCIATPRLLECGCLDLPRLSN